ncbi:hypothetical protein LTR36_006096 [Oleoguttula mirabilis]|uniref:NmrA-like domain-containing protein n=1 Tax=Oleoguttula mirabilis TaxID=1507867 RepID=A0AAV9JDI5_9PEZI|nr:hypothetical protein LTR36_006096 [Oleoguttula mirabilis]
MAKLIVVCGATGQIGGSVARRMLKEGWQVRAITRNVEGEAGKALAAKGAELATADYDDEASLVEVFKGANAIFAVTNFWEHLQALGPTGAGEKEYSQMLTIASAASKTASLEHFVLHAIASGEKLAGKEFVCAHWDYKDRAADKIKESMPELAKKTTFLWVGWFASNLFALLRPFELPGSYGAHVVIQPCKPETIMWVTDVEHNVGAYVNAVLAKPSISLPAKYVSVHTDILPYKDVFTIWSEVSGKRCEYIECSAEQYERMYGVFGAELASQYKLNAAAPDWGKAHGTEVVTAEELGIAGELLDLKQSLEANKDKL